jgi:hypothetical protein
VNACIELASGVQWIVAKPRVPMVEELMEYGNSQVPVIAVIDRSDEYRRAAFMGTVFIAGIVSISDLPDES